MKTTVKSLVIGAIAAVFGLSVVAGATTAASKVGATASIYQQGGGQGQRGGMRGQAPRPIGGPGMLLLKEVQKELGLSEEQAAKVKALVESTRPPRGQNGPGGPGGEGPGGPGGGSAGGGGEMGGPPPQDGGGAPGQGEQGGPPKNDERRTKFEASLKEIISGTQFERFQQLDLQAKGPGIFRDPKVVEALGITEEQTEKIHSALSEMRSKGNGDKPADRNQMRKQMMEKATSVLSAGQVTKLNALLGKPFTFPAPPARPQGGGPGGPGGEGPGGGGAPGGPSGPGGDQDSLGSELGLD